MKKEKRICLLNKLRWGGEMVIALSYVFIGLGIISKEKLEDLYYKYWGV